MLAKNILPRALRKTARGLIRAWSLITSTPPLALQKTDYDDYWRYKRPGDAMGAISEFQRLRADWIAERLSPEATVLDVGCGDGAVLLYLRKRTGITAHGCDCSTLCLDFLRSRGVKTTKLDFNKDTAEQLPEADYVLLLEVLEHLQNPEDFLLALARKARKGVFVSIPNTGYFPYRIRLLTGRFVMQWTRHPGEHLRFWTLADFRWWLRQLGLAGRFEVATYEGIPGLDRIWPSLFGMGIVAFIDTSNSIGASDPAPARSGEVPKIR